MNTRIKRLLSALTWTGFLPALLLVTVLGVLPALTPRAAPDGQGAASLGDYVWEDTVLNGLQDPGEGGLDGVTVNLYDGDGNFIITTTTSGGGFYEFLALEAGDYQVEFVLPEGYVFVWQDQGADDGLDSDADPASGRTATITLGAGQVDQAWDAGVYASMDWGDAPETYPTLLSSDGARHRLQDGIYLGDCGDGEVDGQPTPGADGDDVNVSTALLGPCGDRDPDDEEGVRFTNGLFLGQMAEVEVRASSACTLSAWLDFNADGDWEDAGEDLFPAGQLLNAGANPLSFLVPAEATPGETYARFRCTTDGKVSTTGEASDGEVEDYRVSIQQPLDFGDAPAGSASHRLGGNVYLGSCVDGESDGQPSMAVGDDIGVGAPIYGTCTGQDDEDGVALGTGWQPGETAAYSVTANAPCTLTAWLDFNGDGDWEDAGEELFPAGQALNAGLNGLSVPVPAGAVTGTIYARFRCTTEGPVPSTGEALDGEVEDYQVLIGSATDYGDAPAGYPTLAAEDGASHALGSKVYLGDCVDGETDGQPSAGADGDEANVSAALLGTCAEGDDEDGVTILQNNPLRSSLDGINTFTALVPGERKYINVAANAACTLSAWVDYNGDGDWEDADEDLFPGGQALGAGDNYLYLDVPADAVPGTTYARFRCTTDGAVAPTGSASDGEVEDYQMQVAGAFYSWDYGDAPDPAYPTLASDGARQMLDIYYLGSCVDGEADGQPASGADGDDVAIGNGVYGSCAGGDDEDGVVFATALQPGATALVSVTTWVHCPWCYLSAFIDFNGDGDWEDAGEELFPGGQVLSVGTNTLSFPVPADAVVGETYARFRYNYGGSLSPTGAGSYGEVEDYVVAVGDTWDFGDAPDPAYPTLLASDGARHALGGGLYLGGCVDADPDGRPTAGADGDEVAASNPVWGDCAGGDDGVVFASELAPGGTADIRVQASAACMLSGWLDFNADGDWEDAGEALFPGGEMLTPSANDLSFPVPAEAVPGEAYARFRCTTDGAVAPTGAASDGEVEDYQVTIRALDWGDAPDPGYATLQPRGARHVLGSDVYLGGCVDAEPDGLSAWGAGGDDVQAGSLISGTCAGDDDEDGVAFATPLDPGAIASVQVTASTTCTLSAWIDFDGDGFWTDDGEALFPGGQVLAPGANALSFPVPADARAGISYARFRCTTDGPLSPIGLAPDGEVEDHVAVIGSLDFGDAPDPAYPTRIASGGAQHVLGSDVYLGACVDAEWDGQPSAGADGDDVTAGSPVSGTCVGDDDEDGVVFASGLPLGGVVEAQVTANAPCTLSAWIDFNRDGDWTDTGESLFPGGRALAPGANALSIPVPASAVTGTTGARFRCTTDGAVPPGGPASDGEVEDYVVEIQSPAAIGDYVWEDADADGVQDGDEMGLGGLSVNLYTGHGVLVESTTTDARGWYSFTHLPARDYLVEFVAPPGYRFTSQDQGSDDAADSDADPATGRTVTTTLVPGENDLDWDAGLYVAAAIGDRVWEDADADGVQDSGEVGLDGVSVNLYAGDGVWVDDTTTGAGGWYSFTHLAAGDYFVEFIVPPGYLFTFQDQGSDDATDSDADPEMGRTITTTLTPGENDLNWDAGLYVPAAIGDRVWLDTDADGVQDGDETGIGGVTVDLYTADERLVGTTVIDAVRVGSTTTDVGGWYSFTHLAAGDYFVEFVAPPDRVFSPQNQGADDAMDSDADPATGRTVTTTLVPGENDLDWDAGLYELAAIGNYVWLDGDADGIQDKDESGMAGVTVHLYDGDGGLLSSTTTGAGGAYGFTGLAAGSSAAYVVEFVTPPGHLFTAPDQGSDDALDSDADPVTGRTVTFTVLSGENALGWDAGLVVETFAVYLPLVTRGY